MTATENAKPLTKREKLLRLRDVPAMVEEIGAANESLLPLWWACLKESEDYARALRGELGEPWAGVARDFGDLDEAFAFWWHDRGRELFGDLVYQPPVRLLSKGETPHWDDLRPNMFIEIPLSLGRKEIIKQFTALLDKALERRPELRTRTARGLYPDQRIRRDTIETLLKVWRARKEETEDWWQTGERLKLSDAHVCLPTDDAATIKNKQRLMTITVQRYHRMAAALIDFAAKGDFPRVK